MNKKFIFLACVILLVLSCLTIISATDIDSENNYATDTKSITTDTTHGNNVQSSLNKNSYNSGLDTSNSVTTDIGEKNTSQTSKANIHTDTTASMNGTDSPKTEKIITKKGIAENVKSAAVAYPSNWNDLKNAIRNCAEEDLIIYLNQGATYTINNNFTINSGAKNITIIGNGATIDGQNSYRFSNLNYKGIILNITNVTFSNCGKVNVTSGGVFLAQDKSTVYISNCTFINSSARNGGVFYYGNLDSEEKRSSLYLNNSKFINSYATNHAGLGHVKFTDLTIDNCHFLNTTSYGIGGTFFISSGNLTVINSIFDDGKSMGTQHYSDSYDITNYAGSALHICSYAPAIIRNNTFKNNYAMESGAIAFHKSPSHDYPEEGTIQIVNNTFFNNSAAFGAAIAIYDSLDLVVENNSFINNTAFGRNTTESANGGAIWVNQSKAVILTNNSFENNTAYNGGAIYSLGKVNSLDQTFITNNATNGGAIYSNGTFTSNYDTFEENSATNGGAYYSVGNVTSNMATFNNNSATVGGALFLNGSASDFTGVDDVYNNNSASNGGAVYIGDYAKLTSTNGQFINNDATECGGVFYIDDGATFNTNYDVCINNTAVDGGVFYVNHTHGTAIKALGLSYIDNNATNGGVIYLENGVVDSEDEKYINNTADIGGAIYNLNGTIYSINDTLDGNIANIGGGAFIGKNATLVKKEGTDINNIAVIGGAIYNNGTFNSTGSNFTSNNASIGGVIFNNGISYITGDTFTNNNATAGGAVYNNATIKATSNTFTGNNATNGGALLDNGTLSGTGNNYYNNTALENGGAVYSCDNHAITIENVEFSGNVAGNNGGAIYTEDNVTIVSSHEVVFDNNSAVNGGAVYLNTNSNLNTSGDIYRNNNATTGGAVYACENATVVVQHKTEFESNNATTGGAIYLDSNSVLNSTSSSYDDNTAEYGSAIYAKEDSNITLTDNTFKSNKADYGTVYLDENVNFNGTHNNFEENEAVNGGAIYTKSDINLDSNIFKGNTATGNGGAVYADEGTIVSSYNDQYTSNAAVNGGAVYLDMDALINITKVTFTLNNATTGGAVYASSGSKVNSSENTYGSNNATDGGVFYIESDASVNSSDDSFTSNTAENGGVFYNLGNVTSTNSNYTKSNALTSGVLHNDKNANFTSTGDRFTSNTATDGAVMVNNGNVTITQSTLDSNVGINSVIFNKNEMELTDNTVSNNYVTTDDGKVIYNTVDTTSIVNNLFVNNTASNSTDEYTDMLLGGVKPKNITGNVYIDNYLNDTMEVPDEIIISVNDITHTEVIKLNLSDIYNDTIRNGTITITSEDGTTVASGLVKDGEASIPIYRSNLNQPITPVNVTYTSYSKHYQDMKVPSRIIYQTGTIIEITPIPPTYVDDKVNVTVTLSDINYQPLPNAPVIVYINDTMYERTTNGSGQILITDVSFDHSGIIPVNATFNGNITHPKCTDESSIEVIKVPTGINLTLPDTLKHPDDKGIIIATLYDLRDNSTIPGKNLTISFNGELLCNNITDENGNVSYEYTALTSGTIRVEVSALLSTDTKYLDPESVTKELLIEKYNTHFDANVSDYDSSTHEVNVTFTLYTEYNQLVKNKNITIVVKNETGEYTLKNTTDEEGRYKITQWVQPGRDANITIYCPEDYKYKNSTLSLQLKNGQRNTVITVIPKNTVVNKTNEITIYLHDNQGVNLTAKVNLTVGDYGPVEVDVINGIVVYTNSSMTWPEHQNVTAKVEYLGNITYIGSTASSNFRVFRIPTSTSVEILQNLDSEVIFKVNVTSEDYPTMNYGNVTVQVIAIKNGVETVVDEFTERSISDSTVTLTTNRLSGYKDFKLNATYNINNVFFGSHDLTKDYSLREYQNTTIDIHANTPILVDQEETIEIVLKEANTHEVIANKILNITINGTNFEKNYTLTTDGEGKVHIPISFDSVGDYNITASFDGDTYYNKSTNKSSIVVKQKTVIVVNVTSPINALESTSINVTLKDIKNNPLHNQKVIIKAGEQYFENITDDNGMIVIDTSYISAGIKNVTASFEGTDYYYNSEGKGTIIVNQLSSILTVMAESPVHVGNNTKIEGYLTLPNGTGIIGTVNIYVNGAVDPIPLKTDDQGYFSVDYPTSVIGINNVTASFVGNETISGFSDKTNFKVDIILTDISVDADRQIKVGETTYITGILEDQFGQTLGDTIVNITINGTKHHTRTEPDGSYSLEFTPSQEGIYDITVNFTGNYTHKKSYDIYQIKVDKIVTHIDVTATTPVRIGDSTLITGRLFDRYENNLTHTKVTLKINDTVIESKNTDMYGNFEFTYKTTALGLQNITIEYDGSNKYYSTYNLYQVKVEQIVTHFDEVTALNVEYGFNTTISGILIDEFGNYLGNVQFNMTVEDGEPVLVTTDNYGRFSVEYNSTLMGLNKVHFNYTGNFTHKATEFDTAFTVSQDSVFIDYNITDVKAGNVTINVTLTDEEGNPVPEGTVFVYYGEDGEELGNATVSANGTAIINVPLEPGKHDINIVYNDSNGRYKYANKIVNVNVPLYELNLTIDPINDTKVGNSTNITGFLKYEGKPVSNVNVTIVVDGIEIANVTTGVDGSYSCQYNATTHGFKEVVVVYPGNDTHAQQKVTSHFTVSKIATSTTFETPDAVKIGKTASITGVLVDEYGKAVPNAKITVKVGNITVNTTTNSKGKYTVKVTPTKLGANNVIVTYGGNTTYMATNNNGILSVDRIDTIVTTNVESTVKVGDKQVINGVLKDQYGEVIPNAKITVTVNDKNITTKTDAKGKYSVDTTTNTVGVNNVTVTYAGNNTYYPITNSRIFTVEKHDSKISADMPDVKAGNSTLVANITDEKGNPISKGNVTITTPDGKKIKATIKNGKINVTVPTIPGKQTYTITYDGDSNHLPGTSSFTVNVPKIDTKITVNKLSSSVVDAKVRVTGTLKDSQGNVIPKAKVTVKYANTTVTVTTTSNGSYSASIPNVRAGTNKITVTYDGNDTYKPSSAKTSQKILKITTKVIVKPIRSIVGENITLTAHVTDKNNKKVSGGTLVFKINGRTLREDGRFDTNKSNPMIFKVNDGIVTITLPANLYLTGAVNISASYSGSYKYTENTSNVAVAKIQKRKAKVSVTAKPAVVKQNTKIVFTAKVTDVTKGIKNKTVVNNGIVIFKINGKTLKDDDGNVIKVKVVNSKATYTYPIASGTAGVDSNGVRNYKVTAVYHSDYFVSDATNSTTYQVERSPITIKIKNATVKGKKLSLKGSITDYQNKKVVGTNKVCVKINGKTYKVNGKTQFYSVKNGNINIKNIPLNGNTKINKVQIVSGDRQAYLSGRGSTTKITTL